MTRRFPSLLVAVLLPFACDSARERQGAPMPVVDSLFADFDRPGMPGASVLVMRGDSVLVQKAFGLADVDAGVRATPETNYRLASVSKQFTAMSILLLVADGSLAVSDLASKYLPELPPHASAVTVRHLLTHTSGIRDYEDFVPDTQAYQVKDHDALDLIRTRAETLYFTPGSAWRYSNSAYALLALIVERVSGQRYGDFLAARIFGPVGMTATVAHEEGRTTVAHRAYGHRIGGDTVRRTDQSNTSAVLGDGGIYSSIVDLARWHAALNRGTLIPTALWQEATTPFVLTNGTPTEYGYGWFIETFANTQRLRHHGETRGFTNIAYRFPAQQLTIVVLTNRSDSAPWDRADRIATALLGGE
ncbi:MAG: beta-lactamase family protein [Cytophagaceae bacterium]|nr:beta-lactamase family protein [Gemmatimonadaceae bacterium]